MYDPTRHNNWALSEPEHATLEQPVSGEVTNHLRTQLELFGNGGRLIEARLCPPTGGRLAKRCDVRMATTDPCFVETPEMRLSFRFLALPF